MSGAARNKMILHLFCDEDTERDDTESGREQTRTTDTMTEQVHGAPGGGRNGHQHGKKCARGRVSPVLEAWKPDPGAMTLVLLPNIVGMAWP